jgi:hypothetical protein
MGKIIERCAGIDIGKRFSTVLRHDRGCPRGAPQ